ncbi:MULTISPECIES: DUF6526 family protein [unclassified Kaistella]|uniref:DUF6526 family protein n=1 Tax=unclassified Kaistella TaxID=2762626 RepID=UPI002733D643|nr:MULTISPECIES: DUF6526 family protein [unclassified Kaistella]MDP2453126.1 DUF6526 family protein [Kaistella sp. SH11-4b]MDP2456183.1 DUF6526 family protein [Kaistella sp. SH40-3]MDP2458939.1 DUF6526 family protein [Kaistella sp. SH19-2b]
MKNQNYNNYIKFYPPHHFIYLPLLGFLQILGIWKIFNDEPKQLIWILFSVVIFLFIYLALMVRQHYALGNQDRIVRLEFRLRYFELFGKSSDEVESQLSFGQIAALRFAYDDEFRILVEKALQQNISADEIKKSITNWKADNSRV